MPPSERLRIAVAGLGSRGQFHLERLLLRDDCEVVAAVDPASACRERWSKSIPHLAGSLSPGLLQAGRVQAVWLATPDGVTPELVELALQAGCAVVLEPPFGLSPDEVDRLLQRAEAKNQAVVLHLPSRTQTEFRQACRVVRSGRLGRLRSLSRSLWQLAPLEPGGGHPLRLNRQALPWLDQAQQLAGGVSRLVWSRQEPRDSIVCQAPADERAMGRPGGLELLVEFGEATMGWFDLQWNTPAAWDSGWRLRGTRGAWHSSGGTSGDPSGELLEFTDEDGEQEAEDPLEGILRHLRGEGPNPGDWREVASLAWWLGKNKVPNVGPDSDNQISILR